MTAGHDAGPARRRAEGPYFDELVHGQVIEAAPAVTLTEALAAQHQAIAGDRLALALDHRLSESVTGRPGLAHPALVWDIAIGQSTLATHHVKANLFYRALAFHRLPHLGDTLLTRTTVVGLRENRRKEGRQATGLAALRIVTSDEQGRTVLDFYRCAMIPLREDAPTGHNDSLDTIGEDVAAPTVDSLLEGWRTRPLGHGSKLTPGDAIEVVGGDVVSSAPELARLTLNVARVHHDARAAGGRRLAYGGHTIAVAAAQLNRAVPALVTITSWKRCDHVGPVYEGDTLRTTIDVEAVRPLRAEHLDGVDLRVVVNADPDDETAPSEQVRVVLDWRLSAVVGHD